MRYISPKSIQLAINTAKLRPTIHPSLPNSAFCAVPQRAPKYIHSLVQKKLLPSNCYRISLPKQAIRNCSYQRKMCYAQADAVGGSVDVTKGREVLPTNVKPVHYDLTLEPNLEKFNFEGTVIIEYVTSYSVLQVRRDTIREIGIQKLITSIF